MKRLELVALLPGIIQKALSELDMARLGELDDGQTHDDELSPFAAVIDAMSTMHQPVQAALQDLPRQLTPQRADPRFLPMLASWVDLELRMGATEQAKRLMLIDARRLWRQRGTAAGVRAALAHCLGRPVNAGAEAPVPTVIAETGTPFHVEVRLPAEAKQLATSIEILMDFMKPAHVTHSVHYESANLP